MVLDLTSLEKSIISLERAINVVEKRKNSDNIFEDEIATLKAGVIQNFEVAYELCWKFIQRWIRENRNPQEADFPITRKELFRKAALYELIQDPLLWFNYGEHRNLTSHTYNTKSAEDTYKISIEFLKDAKFLYDRLESSND